MDKSTIDFSYTQNRELSWLEFNRRVLQEGMDPRTPLLERLKFIAIFTSNLDEFFMVRVGSLHNLAALKKEAIDNKTGWTAERQLDEIHARMPQMYAERDAALEAVEKELAEYGVARLDIPDLTKKEATFLDAYYQDKIVPILSPLVIDARHPFPHLPNGQIHLFSEIEDAKGRMYLGIVAVPLTLPPIIFLPGGKRYILVADLLKDKVAPLFQGFKLKSLAVISVTRNADINLDEAVDDFEENLRQQFKKALKKRNRLSAVRLEIRGELPESSLEFLMHHHELSREQIFFSKAPLQMKYAFMLEDKLEPSLKERLCYRPFAPQPSPRFRPSRPVKDQILEKDALLHFPYESMDPFLRLLKEASTDPTVVSIKITIYRMASVSKVAEYLAQAAENGKEVLALMELRARFDEENNIDYSERLEQAGCTIIYGFEDYKVHSKICLITFYDHDRIRTITQIGTGNYNEKTAKQYTDFCFMTADEEIGRDATAFFKNMLINQLDGKYTRLLAAPTGIKPAFMSLFDREIRRAKRGEPAKIVAKFNSISERDIIDKLMEASCAGVEITLIVRGICCIRPGIPGKTENVRVISIVGRFLEHHRIYAFGADREDIYISSADLMTRNILRRVELAVPLTDPDVRDQINRVLDICLADDTKAKELLPDGTYRPVTGETNVDAQATFMAIAEQNARQEHYERRLAPPEPPKEEPEEPVQALPQPDAETLRKIEEKKAALEEAGKPGFFERLFSVFRKK